MSLTVTVCLRRVQLELLGTLFFKQGRKKGPDIGVISNNASQGKLRGFRHVVWKERGQGHAKRNPTPTATLLLSPFPKPVAESSRALIVTRHIRRPATVPCLLPRTGCALSVLF